MFEIKISNKERERSRTMNFGTNIEEKLYIKIEAIIDDFLNDDSIPNLK